MLNNNLNNLNSEEVDVMFNKATERAFTGEYTDTETAGVYICRNCNTKLYTSASKFHSGCGWPSFDDVIDNNVREVVDADGRRVEILCNHCGIHLGHVFRGERLTDKDTRYCVNSLSMKLVANDVAIPKFESVVLGCGCFWGVEHWFKKLKGIIRTQVGYSGGEIPNPTYRQVCNLETGHREVLLVDFDPAIISLEEVLRYFFEIHDFTQTDGQGNDKGSQYEPVIFYENPTEKAIAEKIILELTNKDYKVATKLFPKTPFWTAENYHQDYYGKNGHKPYCHFYKKIF